MCACERPTLDLHMVASQAKTSLFSLPQGRLHGDAMRQLRWETNQKNPPQAAFWKTSRLVCEENSAANRNFGQKNKMHVCITYSRPVSVSVPGRTNEPTPKLASFAGDVDDDDDVAGCCTAALLLP